MGIREDRAKEAAKVVADKLAGKGKAPAASTAVAATATATDTRIAGLLTLTPDLVVGAMPAYHPEKYQVVDALNPPDTLPQASESQLDRGLKIYEGATRALKLTGAAFDLAREKFITTGKHAKAFGAGVQAATELEKVRGNYLDYLSQKETTSQKAVTLDINQVKTVTDTNIAVFTKDELTQRLKQAELKAEELRLKTIESEGKLSSFKQQLGDYLEVK